MCLYCWTTLLYLNLHVFELSTSSCFFQGLNFLLNVFLRLIHVAYRFHWFMFCCVRIYVSFLFLTDICFQYFAETDSDTMTIPGACVCSLSGYTPGRTTESESVCTFSLTRVTAGHFQSGVPSLQLKGQFFPLHVLQTVVLSDLSFIPICWKLSDSSCGFGLHLHGYQWVEHLFMH